VILNNPDYGVTLASVKRARETFCGNGDEDFAFGSSKNFVMEKRYGCVSEFQPNRPIAQVKASKSL
jgi:hypothetical protein